MVCPAAPCTVRRSSVIKNGATTAANPVRNFSAELQNVVNSIGNNPFPYAIAGTTTWGTGGPTIADDVTYATYKVSPVFTFLDQNGAVVAGIPPDLAGGNWAAGVALANAGNIRVVSVVLNMLSPTPDMKTYLRLSSSMRGMVKINNLN